MKKKLQLTKFCVAKMFLLLALFGFSEMAFGQIYVSKKFEYTALGDVNLKTSTRWFTERGAINGNQGFFSAVNSAKYLGADDTRFIDGYVKHYALNATAGYTFPVGGDGQLRAFSINDAISANSTVAVAWIAGNPGSTIDPTDGGFHSVDQLDGLISEVITEGQWDWHVFGGNYNGLGISVSIPDLTGYPYTSDQLRVVGWNGSQWTNLSGDNGATSLSAGTIVSGTMKNNITAVSLGFIGEYIWTGAISTDWNTAGNWKGGKAPNGNGANIQVASDAQRDLHVPVGEQKIIGDFTNNTDKALVVPANSTLIIEGNLVGSDQPEDVNKIIVLADANKANGSIVFKGQNCNENIYGTVQFYSKASMGAEKTWIDNISGSPTIGKTFKSKYNWQYFGVPVESVKAAPTFFGSFLREYRETANSDTAFYGKWITLHNESVLRAFKGYEITRETPKKYNISGKLQHCDATLILTRKASVVPGAGGQNRRYGLGQNIFGNSYIASIDITQLTFPAQIESTVYLYNTGSFADWGSATGTNGQPANNTAGQYTAIPKNTAPAFGQKIPSMNGFLLRFNNGETYYGGSDVQMTLPYNATSIVPNERPQTAPAKSLSYLEVALDSKPLGKDSKSTIDKLWLFSQEGTSQEFDDGWDGYKFFGTPNSFIYSETPAGNLQVNTSETLHNQLITFYANDKDSQYKLILTKHNLGDYENLTLLDLVEKKSVALNDQTTVYQFTADRKNTLDRRFKIVNSENITEQMFGTIKDLRADFYNNSNLDVYNYTNNAGLVKVFDISGRLVLQKDMNIGVTKHQVNLEQGAYVVLLSAGSKEYKIKIVIE